MGEQFQSNEPRADPQAELDNPSVLETPIPDWLSPEEFQRLGNTIAALLDSIDARQVDAATFERIKLENNVGHKKQS